MAKFCGKNFLIQVETTPGSGIYATLGGLETNGIKINNTAVDTTTKDEMNYRELLAGCGLQTVEMSGNGKISDNAVYKQVMTSIVAQTILRYRLVSGLGDKFIGLFLVTNLDRAGDKAEAETFTMTFTSSGQIVWTPNP